MDLMIFLAAMGVLLAWGVVLLGIRYWGPGLIRRSLLCPDKKVPARVTFQRNEGSFGSLKVVGVEACSLFSNVPVTCDKHCVG